MNKTNTRGTSLLGRLYGILLVMTYLGCIVTYLGCIVVDAQFQPADRTALKTAVNNCLDETGDGSCPNFAKKDGNGVIGDWDVSKVTDFQYCKFAPQPPRRKHLFDCFCMFSHTY